MNGLKKMKTLRALLMIGVLCMGCDGLVDSSHEGTALAEINGTLSIAEPGSVDGPISIAVAWIDAPEDGVMMFVNIDDPGEPDPYADDPEAAPEPEEDPPLTEQESACPDFEGDAEDEVVCDGTLAPHQTAVCEESAGDVWSLVATEYKSKSLVEFSLPIYELPPQAARVDLSAIDGKGWMAEGIVVAFSDKNGNQRFDKGNSGHTEDRLLSASLLESEDAYYYGKIVFFSENEPQFVKDMFMYAPKKGFSLVIDDGDGVRTVDADQSLPLMPIEASGGDVGLASLQCTDIEYQIDFNGPAPTSATGMCAVAEWGMTAEEIYREWEVQAADPSNPCVIHIYSGFACYTDEGQLPPEWLDLCGMGGML